MQTKLYIIHKKGNYLQRCAGVYTTCALAVEAACYFLKHEADDYYSYVIHELELDQMPLPDSKFTLDIPGEQLPYLPAPLILVAELRKSDCLTKGGD